MNKEYFKQNIISELENRGLSSNDISVDLIADIASDFFNMVEVKGRVFLGVKGYLGYVYGCLLKRFVDVARLHNGEILSDVPELVTVNNEIDEFLEYTKKYLGFEEEQGGFKEV